MSTITSTPLDPPYVSIDGELQAPPVGVKWLNDRFRELKPQERIRLFFKSPVLTSPRVLVTSSFGTTAALLLHMLRQAEVDYPIYFLNTSFHFLETLGYRETLTQLLSLDVRELRAAPPDLRYTLETGLWAANPERCCNINKVRPLDRVKSRADIWVSGLMNWQSSTRKDLEVFEWKDGTLKFYPLVDLPEAEAETYYGQHGLPRHPLSERGYASVGCSHCTQPGDGRDGRWAGSQKTECGLHGR